MQRLLWGRCGGGCACDPSTGSSGGKCRPRHGHGGRGSEDQEYPTRRRRELLRDCHDGGMD